MPETASSGICGDGAHLVSKPASKFKILANGLSLLVPPNALQVLLAVSLRSSAYSTPRYRISNGCASALRLYEASRDSFIRVHDDPTCTGAETVS